MKPNDSGGKPQPQGAATGDGRRYGEEKESGEGPGDSGTGADPVK